MTEQEHQRESRKAATGGDRQFHDPARAMDEREREAQPVEVEAGVEAGVRSDAGSMQNETKSAEQDRREDSGDEELNRFIEHLCVSKAEEFHLLGYEHVTGQEVWECVSATYEKKGVPLLHRIVNDILSLKITTFMNWMTMQAYTQEDFYKEWNT